MQVIARLNIGGPAIHTILLTKHLNNEWYRTTLISGSLHEGEGDMSYLLNNNKDRHIFLPQLKREISFLTDLRILFKLLRIFRREKPDIVHTHTAKAGIVGRLAASFAGVHIRVHTFHGHVFHGYFSRIITLLFIWIEKFLTLISTRIIVISEKQKEDICYKYKIAAPDKVTVIPIGFEFHHIRSNPKYRGTIKNNYKIPDNEIVISIIGRLTEIKNHDLFLEIAYHLLKQYPTVHFLIIGDGHLRDQLTEKVVHLNLNNSIHFTGWISDIPKIYSNTDILLLTSINEGTPNTIIEAMYNKIPVVATNVGGVPDIISNGKDGFIIDSFHYNDFIPILIKLIYQPKFRSEIGEAAHKKVVTKFAAQRLVNDMKTLYHNLLNKEKIS
jgi:glycosyltransferase involved in cell wall biosynthesis